MKIQALNEPDTILSPGQPAPFFGVLVNEPRYRIYTVDHLERKEILDDLDNRLSAAQAPIGTRVWDTLGWLGMGLLTGLAIGLAISH